MRLCNIFTYVLWVAVAAFIYIVLREDISVSTFIIGLVLGICALVVCIFFFDKRYLTNSDIKKLPLIWYMINLLIIIIISGIKSLILAIFHDSTSEQLTYSSYLKNDMLITLLANSITLTPGTVTLDKSGNVLKVLKLCKKDCDLKIDDIKHLEKMISKIERD